MAYAIVSAATSLQIVLSDGTIQTLTLPPGVEVRSGERLRSAVIGRNAVIANAVTRPVWVDADGEVRQIHVPGPVASPVLATGAAGTLTGTFRVKMSNLVKDGQGRVLQESALSRPSNSQAVATQKLSAGSLPIAAGNLVNARRLYRTATNGTSYFHWLDIDDNTTTSFEDDASDESLALVPAPTDNGSAPARMTLLCEWKGRIWAISASDIDTLLGSASNKFYAWPLSFPVRPVGGDKFGVTGFMPRRDELGVCKRDIIWKMTGDSETTFRLVKVIEGKGSWAPDACQVIRDVGYFFGGDGVYTWSSEGVQSITDETVFPWFNSDDYFNRSEFPNAIATYDPERHQYLLFLASAGQTTLDRWVSFDIAHKRWLGPHKTAALVPTCGATGLNSAGTKIALIGAADGYLYAFTDGNFTDGTASAIDFDVTGKFHAGKPPAPDVEHFWGELSMLSKIEAGGTLTITPKTGGLDAAAGTALSHTLTTGRERLGRVGSGRLCQLRFRENTAGQGLEIYGYELPWHELGKR